MVSVRPTQIDKIVSQFVNDYNKSLGHVPHYLKQSMAIAYEKGVRHTLEWVKDYGGYSIESTLYNLNGPKSQAAPTELPLGQAPLSTAQVPQSNPEPSSVGHLTDSLS